MEISEAIYLELSHLNIIAENMKDTREQEGKLP